MPFGIPSEDFHGGFGIPYVEEMENIANYMNEYKITVNYDEALFLSAAIVHFLRHNSIGPEDWPNADIDYLIGQIQEAVEELEETK